YGPRCYSQPLYRVAAARNAVCCRSQKGAFRHNIRPESGRVALSVGFSSGADRSFGSESRFFTSVTFDHRIIWADDGSATTNMPRKRRHSGVAKIHYSAATGLSSGRNGSSFPRVSSGSVGVTAAFSRRRSTIKSWKHSTGTEYFRSAVEYFVRKDTTMLSPPSE